ncbi:MAG: ATP-binding cassette domain-containing protein [Desulfovibrio sp.]
MLGPSGCGKYTTLRLIAGLRAFSGRIHIGDRDVTVPGRHHVAMVFQSYALRTSQCGKTSSWTQGAQSSGDRPEPTAGQSR